MNAHLKKPTAATPGLGVLLATLRRIGLSAHSLLIVAVIGAWIWISVAFMRSAAQREPTPVPPTMEVVNWSDPASSAYCVACHRTVGPAMAGLDVEHGHPINVCLSEDQIAAVRSLGTIVGPGDTLICMSCHVLSSGSAFMLADTLEGSRLCEHCHPRQFAIDGAPHDFRHSAPELTNRLGQDSASAGPCSACHAAHSYTQDFKPCDLDPTGRCVACHEAPRCSDDAARVALDHPKALCTECHEPHRNEYGHYLRRPLLDSCTECHSAYAGGPTAGMHPVGTVDRAVPDVLIAAGAAVGGNPFDLTCSVCHSAHAAARPPLLRLEPDQNQLCLACHESDLTARMPDGELPRHGREPQLDASQQAAVLAWGGRIGPTGALQCASCHRVHEALANSALLAFSMSSDDSCAACHPEQSGVIGSAHDLRIDHPDEANLLGVSAARGGACSACHLGHGLARAAVPAPGDAAGVCTTCHQPGACGQEQVVAGVVHPETSCTDCHDPHERKHGRFLAKAPADLCADCHAEQFAMIGGPHDWRTNPDDWPQQYDPAGGMCLSCHYAHGGERRDLHRFGSAANDVFHDDACLSCHADAGWNAESSVAIIHPHAISPEQNKVALALVPTDDEGRMRMGCRTCHNPHGGPEPIHLARVQPDEPTERLCLQCHDHKHVLVTGHSSPRLNELGYDVDSCKPCHAMHAERDGAWGQMLSPRFLMEGCEQVGEGTEGCVPCLACHHVGGPAPLRDVFTHPPVLLTNVIDVNAPGFLPLFNAAGHVDPLGQVTCRTCHLAHGSVPLGTDPQAAVEALTPEQQSSRRFSVRPFVAPNTCTTCHGFEARWRYLFFHDPLRRRGPSPLGTPQLRPGAP